MDNRDPVCYTAYTIRKLHSDDLKEALLAFQRDGLVPLALRDALQIRLNIFSVGASKAEKRNWTENAIVTATAVAYRGEETKVVMPYAKPLVKVTPDTILDRLRMPLSEAEYNEIKPRPWQIFRNPRPLLEDMRTPLTPDAAAHNYAWRRAIGDEPLIRNYAGLFTKHQSGMAVDLMHLGTKESTLYPLVLGPVPRGSGLRDERVGPSRHIIIGAIPEILEGVEGLLNDKPRR